MEKGDRNGAEPKDALQPQGIPWRGWLVSVLVAILVSAAVTWFLGVRFHSHGGGGVGGEVECATPDGKGGACGGRCSGTPPAGGAGGQGAAPSAPQDEVTR